MNVCQVCKQSKLDVVYYPDLTSVWIFELATGVHPLLPESEGLICFDCSAHFDRMFYTVRRVLLSRGFIT